MAISKDKGKTTPPEITPPEITPPEITPPETTPPETTPPETPPEVKAKTSPEVPKDDEAVELMLTSPYPLIHPVTKVRIEPNEPFNHKIDNWIQGMMISKLIVRT